jgi:hypothetical protein
MGKKLNSMPQDGAAFSKYASSFDAVTLAKPKSATTDMTKIPCITLWSRSTMLTFLAAGSLRMSRMRPGRSLPIKEITHRLELSALAFPSVVGIAIIVIRAHTSLYTFSTTS